MTTSSTPSGRRCATAALVTAAAVTAAFATPASAATAGTATDPVRTTTHVSATQGNTSTAGSDAAPTLPPHAESYEPGTVAGRGIAEGSRRLLFGQGNNPSTQGRPTAWPAAAFGVAMRGALNGAITQTALKGRVSALVADESGSVQWSTNAGTPRLPASTNKVVTAFAAMAAIPGTDVFPTYAMTSAGDPGNVYLRGGGDPTLTTSRLRKLANATIASLKAEGRTRVGVMIDDTLFPQPTMAKGWKSSYLDGDVQRVRALTYAGYRGVDGAMAVGKDFAAMLSKGGISVRVTKRQALPKRSATVNAATSSAPFSSLLRTMLNVSQNDYAEYFYRHVAVRAGRTPTWANAALSVREKLTAAGVPTRGWVAADGSGLSRSNRLPAPTLAGVIARMLADPTMREMAFDSGAMPRSGQSGTLRARFSTADTRCARGKVWAKTGTLNDVVGLAGIAYAADGSTRIFVVLENGNPNTTAARQAVDRVATAVVGCRLNPPTKS